MVRSRVSGTTNAEDVVGQEVQRPAVGRQLDKSARVHGDTGTLTRLACREFAPARVTNASNEAAE